MDLVSIYSSLPTLFVVKLFSFHCYPSNSRIASLARAAVSGDESALDQLSSVDGSNGASKQRGSNNANHGVSFYVGSSKGE